MRRKRRRRKREGRGGEIIDMLHFSGNLQMDSLLAQIEKLVTDYRKLNEEINSLRNNCDKTRDWTNDEFFEEI